MSTVAEQLQKMTPADLAAMTPDDYKRYKAVIDRQVYEHDGTVLYRIYPENGPLSRHHYAKHLAFFAAGLHHQERAAIAANRSGKSFAVCYELCCHLTGWYPPWWVGRRFSRPVVAWVSGEDAKAVRESLQLILLGSPEKFGTGLIPRDRLGKPTPRAGVADAIDSFTVRWKERKDEVSRVVLKTYDQGRESFQAAKIDIMVFDEEPPANIYSEGLTRTVSTVPGELSGIVMCAFTPLKGLSDVVQAYLPGGVRREGAVANTNKFVLFMAWGDDTPHLSAEARAGLLQSYLPNERDARTKGIPSLGSGAIYPVSEDEFMIDPFRFPIWYKHVYALDVGWNRTAALWGAEDPETHILYLYGEYYRGQAEPAIHGAAIKGRGAWIPGVVDPASRGRSQIDGRKLINLYREANLVLTEADHAVEAGLNDVWQRLSTGRIKGFRGALSNFLEEYRIYRRNEKGVIVEGNDHLMDCVRYLCRSGLNVAVAPPYQEWGDRPGLPGPRRSQHRKEHDPMAVMNQPRD